MNIKLHEALEKADIPSYVSEFVTTGDWCSYRFAGDPFAASQKESRFNTNGVSCFYIADSIETAQHEKRFNFDKSELYRVPPSTFYTFNAEKFAQDFGLTEALIAAKEDGGHTFCQQIAHQLTGTYGLSGVYYQSPQMALSGKNGGCIALLPQHWQLDSGKLYIFQKVV